MNRKLLPIISKLYITTFLIVCFCLLNSHFSLLLALFTIDVVSSRAGIISWAKVRKTAVKLIAEINIQGRNGFGMEELLF